MAVTPIGAATPPTSSAPVPGSAKLTFRARSGTSTIVEVSYAVPDGEGVSVTADTARKTVQVNPSGTTVSHDVAFARIAGRPVPGTFIVVATVTDEGVFQFVRQWTILASNATKTSVTAARAGGGRSGHGGDRAARTRIGQPQSDGQSAAERNPATTAAAKEPTATKSAGRKAATPRPAARTSTAGGSTARTSPAERSTAARPERSPAPGTTARTRRVAKKGTDE